MRQSLQVQRTKRACWRIESLARRLGDGLAAAAVTGTLQLPRSARSNDSSIAAVTRLLILEIAAQWVGMKLLIATPGQVLEIARQRKVVDYLNFVAGRPLSACL